MFQIFRNVGNKRKKYGKDEVINSKWDLKTGKAAKKFSFRISLKKKKSEKPKTVSSHDNESKNVEKKNSARPTAYQVSFRATATGKNDTTKRRIQWCFGYPNTQALSEGRIGRSCEGEEHVVMMDIFNSGESQIVMDQRVIHSTHIPRRNHHDPRAKVLEHKWVSGNHEMQIIAHAGALAGVRDFRQYDFLIDGESFFTMPKVFDLGTNRSPSTSEVSSGSFSFPMWLSSNRSSHPASPKEKSSFFIKQNNKKQAGGHDKIHWVATASTGSGSVTAESNMSQDPLHDDNFALMPNDQVEKIAFDLDQDHEIFNNTLTDDQVKEREELYRKEESEENNEVFIQTVVTENTPSPTNTTEKARSDTEDIDEILREIESVSTQFDNNSFLGGEDHLESNGSNSIEEKNTFDLENRQEVEDTLRKLTQGKETDLKNHPGEEREVIHYEEDLSINHVGEEETIVSGVITLYTDSSGKVIYTEEEHAIVIMQALARGFITRRQMEESDVDDLLRGIASTCSSVSMDHSSFWGDQESMSLTLNQSVFSLEHKQNFNDTLRQITRCRGEQEAIEWELIATYSEVLGGQDVKEAVLLIQAFVRGYLTRRIFNELYGETLRCRRVERELIVTYSEVLGGHDIQEAVLTMQAVVRGYLTRRHFFWLIATYSGDQHVKEAVVIIQAVVRGYLARREKQLQKYVQQYIEYQREGAVVLLQALARGYLARRREQLKSYRREYIENEEDIYRYESREDSTVLSLTSGISGLTADVDCAQYAGQHCPEKTHGIAIGTVIAIGTMLLL